jgi:mannose-6-phosphate isomerase-like protein (cupin superfamily)
MKAHELNLLLDSRATSEVTGSRRGQFWDIDPFDGGSSWLMRWVGESPWERHSSGDEFIHVLKGEVEVTVLTAEGRKSTLIREGSVCVVPRNHWHKQTARSEVVVLGATPGITDESENEPAQP